MGDTFTVLAATTLATDRSGNVIHFAKDPTGELIPGNDGTMEWAVIYTNNSVILKVVDAGGFDRSRSGWVRSERDTCLMQSVRMGSRRLLDWNTARSIGPWRGGLLGRPYRARHDHDG